MCTEACTCTERHAHAQRGMHIHTEACACAIHTCHIHAHRGMHMHIQTSLIQWSKEQPPYSRTFYEVPFLDVSNSSLSPTNFHPFSYSVSPYSSSSIYSSFPVVTSSIHPHTITQMLQLLIQHNMSRALTSHNNAYLGDFHHPRLSLPTFSVCAWPALGNNYWYLPLVSQ